MESEQEITNLKTDLKQVDIKLSRLKPLKSEDNSFKEAYSKIKKIKATIIQGIDIEKKIELLDIDLQYNGMKVKYLYRKNPYFGNIEKIKQDPQIKNNVQKLTELITNQEKRKKIIKVAMETYGLFSEQKPRMGLEILDPFYIVKKYNKMMVSEDGEDSIEDGDDTKNDGGQVLPGVRDGYKDIKIEVIFFVFF